LSATILPQVVCELDLNIRAFPIDAKENKESLAKGGKLQMPVLALGGDIYPAIGGDLPGNFALSSTQLLAANVRGITVPLSGHDSRRAARFCSRPAIQILWKQYY
jgi:hypothetical protein